MDAGFSPRIITMRFIIAVSSVNKRLCERIRKPLKIFLAAVLALVIFSYLNMNERRLMPCDISVEKIKNLKILIKTVSRAFEFHNVTYWVDYGTVLGAYRYCDVIPWDHDADMGYIDTDYAKVLRAAEDVNKIEGFTMDYQMAHYRNQTLDLFRWRKVKNWWCFSSIYNLIAGGEDTDSNYKMYAINPRSNQVKLATVNFLFEHFPVSFIQKRSRVKIADFDVYAMRDITEQVKWRYFLTYDKVVPSYMDCIGKFYNSSGGLKRCAVKSLVDPQ